MSTATGPAQARRVRHRELRAGHHEMAPRAIDELYDDTLDVLTVRVAVNPHLLTSAWSRIAAHTAVQSWARPNETMPSEDVHVLGADAPATPTYAAPRGAGMEEYLASARRHVGELDSAFGPEIKIVELCKKLLGRYSGGRPVQVARSAEGQPFTPCTLRRMDAGRQIGVHHDYHFGLPLYRDLAPTLDTRTLISFVITLLRPQTGGALHVYGLTPDTPGAPKLPNGFQWDLQAIERDYDAVAVDYDVGDLFLLASGRCLHRVAPVQGSQPRVTLGGFLALDRTHEKVLFWS